MGKKMNTANDKTVIRREDNYYGCPADTIWSTAERSDESKRKCYVCAQVCQKVVHRVFFAHEVRNYCSVECFESE